MQSIFIDWFHSLPQLISRSGTVHDERHDIGDILTGNASRRAGVLGGEKIVCAITSMASSLPGQSQVARNGKICLPVQQTPRASPVNSSVELYPDCCRSCRSPLVSRKRDGECLFDVREVNPRSLQTDDFCPVWHTSVHGLYTLDRRTSADEP